MQEAAGRRQEQAKESQTMNATPIRKFDTRLSTNGLQHESYMACHVGAPARVGVGAGAAHVLCSISTKVALFEQLQGFSDDSGSGSGRAKRVR